ncbi:MAG: hypothetical protein KIT17_00950 [Rubrivivax sp.]|nr:hypothetical protein [Rubrivivax sp.]
MREDATHRHRHRKHGAAADMLKHAGIEGLIAALPATIMLTIKDAASDTVRRTLHAAIAKGEHAASQAATQAACRFKVSAPVVIAAVVVGAAVLHGAWRGKRHHEARSYAEAEDERRAQGRESAFERA